MKLLLTSLLCLLLAGCSTFSPESAPEPVQTLTALSGSQYRGSEVEAYSLPLSGVQQVCIGDGGILLLSDRELLLLDESLRITGQRTVDFIPQLRLNGSYITAFDAASRQVLILDLSLEIRHSLTLPGDLSGSPALSSSGSDLYYCTSGGIYRWELDSNIRRRIRESHGEDQQIIGLHRQDTVVQCRISGEDLFLRADTGQLLQSLDGPAQLQTFENRYYCVYTTGSLPNRCFGTEGQETLGLYPDALTAETVFLPRAHGAVTANTGADGAVQLHCFDLSTGQILDSLILESRPIAIGETERGIVLILEDRLLLWQPSDEPAGDRVYTGLWFSSDDPDHAGLARCREYAGQLSEAYGITFSIAEEAAACAPWDYSFTPELRCHVILSQLYTLEQSLRRYPEALLAQTVSHFDFLQIALVQTIAGTDSTRSLSTATGVQFITENAAHVVLASGPHLEQGLYHELFHVMESRILSCSGALDRWEELNPAGFSYDLDLAANAERNAGVYLDGAQRAFVDTYSMSFPREDRARIFEYAMLEDQSQLFRSDIMQSKLRAICTGIREAYDLENYEESLPWEQYLE